MPRNQLFRLRLSDDERQQLRLLAKKQARSESAMIRWLLIKAVQQEQDTNSPSRAAA